MADESLPPSDPHPTEEAPSMAEQDLTPPANPQPSHFTNEAIIESAAPTCSESSIKNADNSAAVTSDEDSLGFADELRERGERALKEQDYSEAAECFSRALEIRVAHYGELALECVPMYYKYGCALLYKSQEEADPLAAMPKKDAESDQGSVKNESSKNNENGESSIVSESNNAEQCASSNQQQGAAEDDEGDEDEKSDAEELGEGDEDESDLDLSWKMLDLARAIAEKHSGDTMEKVDILSALAEVALEREDIETSLSDYQKSLTILERLVEPDSRHVAELNFRICLCLEVGSKAEEAIPYCQKALSMCRSRMQRLMEEVKDSSGSTISAASEVDQGDNQSSASMQSDKSVSDKQEEIEGLKSLLGDLEKKLEDLQQLVSNPTSILSEVLGLVSAKASRVQQGALPAAASCSRLGTVNSSGDFDSPTVSTAHTNGNPGVTHLGIVGRGVKRVATNSGSAESNPAKKPAVEPSTDQGDSDAS